MTDYMVLKKIQTTDDAKDFLKEFYGVEEREEPEEESGEELEEGELSSEQVREALDDLGYDNLSDLFGKWIYNTEEGIHACIVTPRERTSGNEMPNKPNKKEFVRAISPVLIIVHGRKYIEEVPVYEWKNSGLGLISVDVWEGLW